MHRHKLKNSVGGGEQIQHQGSQEFLGTVWIIIPLVQIHLMTCCTVQRPCRSVPWLQQHLLQPCRSVLWLQQHLLHRPAALHERPVAPAAPVAALQERLVAPATPVAASSSLAGASCASSSTRCSPAALQERPVLPEPHLLQRPAALPESPEHLWQRPAALLERPVALAAPVAVSRSVLALDS